MWSEQRHRNVKHRRMTYLCMLLLIHDFNPRMHLCRVLFFAVFFTWSGLFILNLVRINFTQKFKFCCYLTHTHVLPNHLWNTKGCHSFPCNHYEWGTETLKHQKEHKSIIQVFLKSSLRVFKQRNSLTWLTNEWFMEWKVGFNSQNGSDWFESQWLEGKIFSK